MKKLLLIIAVLFTINTNIEGQGCSVCSQTAANGLDKNGAKGLNEGIIYLAFLPLVIMGTLGFIWWKTNKNNS